MTGPIYLDYQATTPLAPEAAAAMRPWLETGFGNPHSSHRMGRAAAAAVEAAREQVMAALTTPLPEREGLGVGTSEASSSRPAIGHEAASSRPAPDPPLAPPLQGGELYFTSGATEAINWALKGAAVRLPPDRRRIVTLATEHAAVLDTVQYLADSGFDVEILPVGADGLVDLTAVEAALLKPTGLVAAMLVNNEIGVIQPVGQIGVLAGAAGALFLCDAVQGFGRVPLPLEACDLVAVSAHKVHGPKGIGGLWIRNGVELDPLLHGGGQEGGLRSGTLSPALCVGFGEAARLLVERRQADHEHVERLWSLAVDLLPGWTLNGSAEARYKGNLSLSRRGVDVARLMSEVREVAFSAGSACASGSGRPSHVLSAIQFDDRNVRSTIRLGFGRYTTEAELTEAASLLNAAANRQLNFPA